MKVLVCGDFGKLHSGHLEHIMEASRMATHLIVVTHTDESIRERKGYEPDPLALRLTLLNTFLKGLGVSYVIRIAKRHTVIHELGLHSPQVFAKGGGYTKDTMPPEEVEFCRERGIQIVYGVGERRNESRQIC